MADMNFVKQTGEPLFPDVLWNQPVNKRAAKNLLIIGGHKNQFSLTQSAYQAALEGGIGNAQVLLPANIRKLIGAVPNCHFLPSTPSGSFSRDALPEMIAMSRDSDGILLAGELSNNAETVGMLEQYLQEIDKPLMLGGEVISSLLTTPEVMLKPHIALIAGQTVFSELAGKVKIPTFVKKPDLMKELKLLEALREHTQQPLVLQDGERIVVCHDGQASVTDMNPANPGKVYGTLATWWLQQPDVFKALTTGVWKIKQ